MMLVIPFWKENAAQVETLVDFIYQLAGRKAYGNVLFVASNEVHPEMREKIKVSGELAFVNSEMIQLVPHDGVKSEQINHAFRSAAAYIARNCKSPFFWMEPDTTPIKPGWYQTIEEAYAAQPKRYAGSFLASGEKLWAARAICYPPDADNDLKSFCLGLPYNVNAGPNLTIRATKQRLVAELIIKEPEDIAKIIPTAVAVHGDKSQILLKKLKAELK